MSTLRMSQTPRLMQQRRSSPLLFLLSVALILAAVALFGFELIGFTQGEDRLPQGITVGGIAVGGLSAEEAQAQLDEAFSTPVVVYYNDAPIRIQPDDLGFRINTSAMLAAARASGESGGGFWSRFFNYMVGRADVVTQEIPLVSTYQESALDAVIDDIVSRYDRPGGRAGYDVETLTTFIGTPGVELDRDAARDAILSAMERSSTRSVRLNVSDGSNATPSIETLQELIIAYLDQNSFIYDGQSSIASIFILDLQSGDEINILGDVAFTAASTNKVPVLIDYFRNLDGEPTQDDAWLMANSLLCSQNSTTNLIVSDIIGQGDEFAGLQEINSTMRQIGLKNTFITAPYIDGSADQEFGSIAPPPVNPNPNFDTAPDPYNQTTAEDMGSLFNMMYDCASYNSGLATIYPGDITQNECRQMLELMSGLKLGRLIEGGVPEGIRISHKNGWVGEITGNSGIVYPPNGRNYIVSIYLWEDTGEREFQDYVRLWPLIEDISRATWNYFEPDQALREPRTDLPPTARECVVIDNAGNRENIYLPPYGEVNLSDIDAWKTASAISDNTSLSPGSTSPSGSDTNDAAAANDADVTGTGTTQSSQPTDAPVVEPTPILPKIGPQPTAIPSGNDN